MLEMSVLLITVFWLQKICAKIRQPSEIHRNWNSSLCPDSRLMEVEEISVVMGFCTLMLCTLPCATSLIVFKHLKFGKLHSVPNIFRFRVTVHREWWSIMLNFISFGWRFILHWTENLSTFVTEEGAFSLRRGIHGLQEGALSSEPQPNSLVHMLLEAYTSLCHSLIIKWSSAIRPP